MLENSRFFRLGLAPSRGARRPRAGRLAILADALLDAGCDDEALIAQCRSAGPRVRGAGPWTSSRRSGEATEGRPAPRQKSRRGFAALSPEQRRAISSMGGKAAHAKGAARGFTRDEAAVANRPKDGMKPRPETK